MSFFCTTGEIKMKKNGESKKAMTPKARTNMPIRRETGMAPLFGPPPFNEMRRFTDDFERMFDEFNNLNFALNPFFAPTLTFPTFTEFETPIWSPQIEVFNKKGEFKVRADLPGLKKEDVNVELLDNALLISGERKFENEEEKEGFYRSELSYGNFFRSIPLPDGADVEHATAKFDNGVLEVAMHVHEHKKKAKKLEIGAPKPIAKAKTA